MLRLATLPSAPAAAAVLALLLLIVADPVTAQKNCTTGQCCNVANQTLAPAGAMCRMPSGSCELPSNCTGNSTDCPMNLVPDGFACHYSARDRYRDTFWSVKSLTPGDDASALDALQADGKLSNHEAKSAYYPRDQLGRGPYYGGHGQYKIDHPPHEHPPHEHYGREPPHRHADDWPDCLGICQRGKCQLQKQRPGCCYLAEPAAEPGFDEDNYGGDGSPGDDPSLGPGLGYGEAQAQTSTPSTNAVDSTEPLYIKGRHAKLVCWDY